MDNFRDIAGNASAYTTSHNGVMRSGVFYRSNALTPQGDDVSVLENLHVKTVVDLRSPAEIAALADQLPVNSRYVTVDLITNSGAFVIDLNNMNVNDVDATMAAGERSFVTHPYARQGLGKVFRELAMADDAALFHCSAGKDRTGWVSAVLQSIAGVSEADIMANYLATNDYTADRINATVAALPSSQRDTYAALMSVQANWLQAGLDQVAISYGSMDNYLKHGLGLDQATLYVLRGKMVRYLTLPGEAALRGNAARGAAFLRALQDSPLSGRYTAFNHYLQSAIDQGSLGGVEQRIGGQVFADASRYLLHQSAGLYDAIAPVISGRGMSAAQSQVWLQGLSGYLATDATRDAGSASEHTQGMMLGVTHRYNDRSTAHGALGYSHGQVSSSGGTVNTQTTSLALGARYGVTSLDDGPWAGLQGSAGYIGYESARHPGGGLGSASGDTHGRYYSGQASLGWLFSGSTITFAPTIGLQMTHLHLDSFHEKGSETALNVKDVNEMQSRVVFDANMQIQPQQVGNWTLTPGMTLGYERQLSDKSSTSHATLYDANVEQNAAFTSKNLYKTGIQLNAKFQRVVFDARLEHVTSHAHSRGLRGNLNITLPF
ncbi:tyrosine-protein phosphatase [Kosakonia sp. BYX6]|uniref:Tyrosine-protein phosphatase n=1 Tax=Kosakonia calanthes TaxID=3139408 RepID=A0ABZ3B3P1_9ENTR